MDIYDFPSSDDDEPVLRDEIFETASEPQREEEKINHDEPILKNEADSASQQEDGSDDHEPLDNLKAVSEGNPRDQEEEDEHTLARHIPHTKARRPYNDDDDSSLGSHYSPSSSDDEGSEDDANRRRGGVNSNSNQAASLSYEQLPVPSPVTLQQQKPYKPGPRSPLKRERQDSLAGGIAHNSNNTNTTNDRPVKRIKGSFNQPYLDLLNRDVQDAGFLHNSHSHQESLTESPPSSSSSSSLELQIGPPTWTTPEKEALFEALSRSGGVPHNTAAIASRIPTKTQFEVARYLHLLESSLTERKLIKSNDLENITISMADIPAAVEISQPCCDALEEAADNLARKEEIDEEKAERETWGGNWLIDEFTLSDVEKSSGVTKRGLLNGLELFRVRNWLELSERVFMNTSCSMGDNWASIASMLSEEGEEEEEGTRRPLEGPGIRAAALEEFYSIVVSLTRRIVAATLYMSEARISAQRGSRHHREVKEEVVWKEDVEAAVLSLGLPGRTTRAGGSTRPSHGWEEFWAGAARRSRLDVYEGGLPLFTAGDSGEMPMSYLEVERKLGAGVGNWEDIPIKQEEEEADVGPFHRHNEGNQTQGGGAGQKVPPSPARSSEISEIEATEDEHEREQVENEVDEFVRTARPFVIPGNIRKLMRKRVRAAWTQEDYADQMDMKASREEERRLWALVGGQEVAAADEPDIVKVEEEEEEEEENSRYTLPRSGKGSVEELCEYYCGDEVGFEGGLRCEEHGDSTGWRFIGDVELEEEAPENCHRSKLDLGRVAAWEVAWMDETMRRGRYIRP